MNILMLDASPKAQNSNSGRFLSLLEARLPADSRIQKLSVSRLGKWQDALAAASQCDALVIAFPVYVDAIPSHLLRYLSQLEKYLRAHESPHSCTVYVIANCGFFESSQTNIAIKMMQCWQRRAGLVWGGGLGIGGGSMLAGLESVPPGRGPRKSLGQQIKAFARLIAARESGETRYCNPNFPRFLFVHAGNASWNVDGKRNGISKNDIKRQL